MYFSSEMAYFFKLEKCTKYRWLEFKKVQSYIVMLHIITCNVLQGHCKIRNHTLFLPLFSSQFPAMFLNLVLSGQSNKWIVATFGAANGADITLFPFKLQN